MSAFWRWARFGKIASAVWKWVRFGTITERIKDSINGIPCEIEYVVRWGRVVGFWAYGYWDPSGPYQGK